MILKKDTLKKGTFVICASPGCGKSYCTKNFQDKFYMLDLDSSNYRYIKDKDGNRTDERNPEFPMNNIQSVKDNIGKAHIIFVSNITAVRKALKDNNIKTIVVYPDKSLKEEFIRRYKERGNDEEFRRFLSDNWERFIDETEEDSDVFFMDKLTAERSFINLSYLENLFNDLKSGLLSEWLNY